MQTQDYGATFFRELWTGQLGLWPTFWGAGVVGASVIFFGGFAGYLELAGDDVGQAFARAGAHWLIYSCFAAVCIWRAAGPASLRQPRSLLTKASCLAPFVAVPILFAALYLVLGFQVDSRPAAKFDSSTAVEELLAAPVTAPVPRPTQAINTTPAQAAQAESVPRQPAQQPAGAHASSHARPSSAPPCIFKSVMSNADYAACGLTPPK